MCGDTPKDPNSTSLGICVSRKFNTFLVRRKLSLNDSTTRHGLDSGYKFPVEELKDRKSTRLNSSHSQISYAVFCLKKKKHNGYLSSLMAMGAGRVYIPPLNDRYQCNS